MWPSLVPKSMCKTPCSVQIYSEGITEEGEPIVLFSGDLKCNYQDSAGEAYDDRHKIINLTAKAYFNGDIAPDIPLITGGTITVFGMTRPINRGTKGRNPDGTVNYTCLEVI